MCAGPVKPQEADDQLPQPQRESWDVSDLPELVAVLLRAARSDPALDDDRRARLRAAVSDLRAYLCQHDDILRSALFRDPVRLRVILTPHSTVGWATSSGTSSRTTPNGGKCSSSSQTSGGMVSSTTFSIGSDSFGIWAGSHVMSRASSGMAQPANRQDPSSASVRKGVHRIPTPRPMRNLRKHGTPADTAIIVNWRMIRAWPKGT